jgi:RHS repeat-associated protein
LPTPYTYTGQYHYTDDITTPGVTEGFGLMFYNARWYDPALSRFPQPDSIIPDLYSPQDWDRYSYARNNPLKYVDPDGHRPCDEERGCGEPVDEFQLRLGRSYEGNWDTKAQQKNQDKLNKILGGIEFTASILSEPVDWILTGKDCIEGKCNVFTFLALCPLIPGSKVDDIVEAIKKIDGVEASIDDALDTALKFLGEGYQDMGKGRFISADGLRQVRMGDADILGLHGKGPHINFDFLGPNPAKPGSYTQLFPSIHVYLFGR